MALGYWDNKLEGVVLFSTIPLMFEQRYREFWLATALR